MGISMIPDLVWGKIGKEFSILMYEPGEVKDSVVTADSSKLLLHIISSTEFPSVGKVTYKVNPTSNKKFAINFRIPIWSANYSLTVNGIKQNTFGKQSIRVERLWKANDKVTANYLKIG
jgi:DUF1680 family protein